MQAARQKLLLATKNQGKIREIQDALERLPAEVVGLDDVLPGLDFEETGRTFVENARAKSLFYSGMSGLLTLAEDSGLEVDALGGAPGVYSARFSSPRPTDPKNNRKLLRLMESVPPEKRSARFVCCMVLSRGGTVIKEICSHVNGSIVFDPRGENGFGYDPLFYYAPFKRTFAEIDPSEKNRVSHRGKALKRLSAFLLEYLKAAG
ncbi:MAG TPA: RdgB/HAM1 family non-canonical purine NTP pyrophosphatase [Candidatus Aminicenantes bacterium]|nr:RdgB/HAM1 family non-canonical purine NTP pyrophosphatase [Candidatus Aminicenantes bacterium]